MSPEPEHGALAGASRAPRVALVPPLLLAALALVQIGLAFGAHLSPWKGGGFGMFASNDHGGFRSVRLVAEGPDGEARIPNTAELDRLRRRVREFPSSPAMQRLARAAAPDAPGARAVRVEVRRLEFDRDDLRPTWQLLVRERVPVHP